MDKMEAIKEILNQDGIEIVGAYPESVAWVQKVHAVKIRIDEVRIMPGRVLSIPKNLAEFIDENKYISVYGGSRDSGQGTYPCKKTTTRDFYVPKEMAQIIEEKLKKEGQGLFKVYPPTVYYFVLKKK